jgi:hypothetical protein
MTLTYLNGSAIARLLGCSRMMANERLRAGHFGEPIQRGRIKYVAQDQIETRVGRQFSTAQVIAAINGCQSRCLTR